MALMGGPRLTCHAPKPTKRLNANTHNLVAEASQHMLQAQNILHNIQSSLGINSLKARLAMYSLGTAQNQLIDIIQPAHRKTVTDNDQVAVTSKIEFTP